MNKKFFLKLFGCVVACFSCSSCIRKNGTSMHKNQYDSFETLVEDEKYLSNKIEDAVNKHVLIDFKLDEHYTQKYFISGICYCRSIFYVQVHKNNERCKNLKYRHCQIQTFIKDTPDNVLIEFHNIETFTTDTLAGLTWVERRVSGCSTLTCWDYFEYSLMNENNEKLAVVTYTDRFPSESMEFINSKILNDYNSGNIICF